MRNSLMSTTRIMVEFRQPTEVDTNQTNRSTVVTWLLTFSLFLSLFSSGFLSLFWVSSAQASSHHAKLLEIAVPGDSIPKTLTFPVYSKGSIEYFSAGLGKEERSLPYPPFALKLIFVQGERAYLAGVTVNILKDDGTPLLMIPGGDVDGPWLFIKIPTGKYMVSGTDSAGSTIKKTITVASNGQTVIHFRFR